MTGIALGASAAGTGKFIRVSLYTFSFEVFGSTFNTYYSGYGSVIPFVGGSIRPSALGGETIKAFEWSSQGGYGSTGTLTLSLTDNTTAVSTYSARVNGVSLGASATGSYDSGSNTTNYTWSSISNPFGTTDGAKLSCKLM